MITLKVGEVERAFAEAGFRLKRGLEAKHWGAAMRISAIGGLAALRHRAWSFEVNELTGNLVAARDAAVRSSEAKSNFLANVSHELRTPLNAILGFSEALASGIFGRLPGRQAEYVGDIHHAGQRLLALINDILDLAKLDAGKLELREEAVSLDKLAAEAIRGLREASSAAGVRSVISMAGRPPAASARARSTAAAALSTATTGMTACPVSTVRKASVFCAISLPSHGHAATASRLARPCF